MRTTVAGSSSRSWPTVTTEVCTPPSLRMAFAALSISSAALRPLMATTSPSPSRRGMVSPARLLRAETARAVTTSAFTRPTASSARVRITVTLSNPRSSTTSWSQITRRSRGSMSVSSRSGRAMARHSPGSPAPLPTSATWLPRAISLSMTAQLSTCRLQRRGISRGPMRPRSVPEVARCSTYRSAKARRSPKIFSAASRSAAVISTMSQPAGASVGGNDDVAARALALGFTDESKIGDGVVNDLAFVGAHRLQGNSLAGFLGGGHGVLCDLLQVACALLTVPVDIQHEAGAVLRRRQHREPGQLLQSFKHFAVTAHEAFQSCGLFLGDDGDVGAAVAHLDVNVAVDIGDVEQFFKIVCSDVALFLEAACRSALVSHWGRGCVVRVVAGFGGKCLL